MTATAQFAIAPTSDFVALGGDPVDVTNTLGVGGTNAAGSATASATAPLTIFYPEIKLVLSKSVKPGGAVAPGATVVAQLPTTTSTDSAYVRPTVITVADEWRNGTADDFFDAFNPIAVAPTQVPLGATLQVEYTTDGGTTYTTLPPGDGATAQIFRATFPAADVANITGVRFIFTKADGFAQGTSVTPAVTFQARATLRSNGQPTSVPDAGTERLPEPRHRGRDSRPRREDDPGDGHRDRIDRHALRRQRITGMRRSGGPSPTSPARSTSSTRSPASRPARCSTGA